MSGADPDSHEPTAGSEDTVWDLVVIGGGTAGIVSAKTAARFGAEVLLIERDEPGGDCLWTGCVPSKSLRRTYSIRLGSFEAAVISSEVLPFTVGAAVRGSGVGAGIVLDGHVFLAGSTLQQGK